MRSSRRLTALLTALALAVGVAPAPAGAQQNVYQQMLEAQQAQQQQMGGQGGQAGQQMLNSPTPGLMTSGGIPQQQQVPSLLAPDTTVNRAGSATEAEAGATAQGPLAEPFRYPGPSRTVFGAALFARGAPTPSDSGNPNYRLSPGDRVSVRVWGPIETEAIGALDNQGNLFLPSIGPLRLAGVRAGDLQQTVEAEVRRIYTQQVQVYAVLLAAGRLGVYVTGYVKLPGRHMGSASDTPLDFLLRAGGVDPARGSYRDITVNRGGRTVHRIDLYPFLLRGSLPNVTLQDGDTIVVGKQGATISADGAVRNNYLFEVDGRSMQGQELIDLAGPLPAATNAVVRGTRNSQPWSRYATLAELRRLPLLDQDVVTFITDAPAPTVRVFVEGSRIGPSVLVAGRDANLCQLLDYIEVNPALADTRSVYILRKRLAAQQLRSINEALDRLERQLFTAASATTGVAEIRTQEAQLVSSYIQRGRRIQPEGRLVAVNDLGRCAPIRLEDGDTIVIPERSDTVLVGGEVLNPGGVVWREGMTIRQYLEAAGGVTQRGDEDSVMIRRASGQVILDPREGPRPGDELIALPQLGAKSFQIARDLLQLIYQTALTGYYVGRL
ncbi:polysaccharide biosynthesis/export family protein [Pseudoroseomonas ludipueritiae]|uniref:Polysaccharide biosynthesis/export family protein n=1 Tax=Pseudoroseomonas ludipueritiae TaxID=198093 RepID=A0ABR7RDH8_9PROT|nr:polysaccharide biosynthesis/export family protein [Pseudoroseomonas ludipueritiae]MBC9179919.1 polysaccharide biosynthesis/export family protein [Pseudoroseomonas ludipueritiae]MCG7363250.1 polysaccharide biosynthesis/export family protein [Roseomonas sp. ACRSG]